MANRRPQQERLHSVASILMLLLTALPLAGCITNGAIDLVPTAAGGLPADTPQRPAEAPRPIPYIAPVSRDTPPLTAEEQKKLQDDLSAVRDRQAASAAAAGEPAKPAPGSPGPQDKKSAAKPGETAKQTQQSSN
jgi:hypothetical protein